MHEIYEIILKYLTSLKLVAVHKDYQELYYFDDYTCALVNSYAVIFAFNYRGCITALNNFVLNIYDVCPKKICKPDARFYRKKRIKLPKNYKL